MHGDSGRSSGVRVLQSRTEDDSWLRNMLTNHVLVSRSRDLEPSQQGRKVRFYDVDCFLEFVVRGSGKGSFSLFSMREKSFSRIPILMLTFDRKRKWLILEVQEPINQESITIRNSQTIIRSASSKSSLLLRTYFAPSSPPLAISKDKFRPMAPNSDKRGAGVWRLFPSQGFGEP